MSWNGVKQTINVENIKTWCEEMGIKDYTINSKGEIDVNGDVDLNKKDFEELPYKFGKVNGSFDLSSNKNLRTLKNCPDYVGESFSCSRCSKLDSLEGCPKEVEWNFYCKDCKKKFTEKEVMSLCKINGKIKHIYNRSLG